MKIPKSLLTILSFIVLLLSSCQTYYISLDSFRQQFAGIDSSKLKTVATYGPLGEQSVYLTSPIQIIKCTDKSNRPVELRNGPSIEIRFTYGDNKKSTFYFDRIYVTDSTVEGIQSRFIPSLKKTIALKEITKIEIQDGGKNFHY